MQAFYLSLSFFYIFFCLADWAIDKVVTFYLRAAIGRLFRSQCFGRFPRLLLKVDFCRNTALACIFSRMVRTHVVLSFHASIGHLNMSWGLYSNASAKSAVSHSFIFQRLIACWRAAINFPRCPRLNPLFFCVHDSLCFHLRWRLSRLDSQFYLGDYFYLSPPALRQFPPCLASNLTSAFRAEFVCVV